VRPQGTEGSRSELEQSEQANKTGITAAAEAFGSNLDLLRITKDFNKRKAFSSSIVFPSERKQKGVKSGREKSVRRLNVDTINALPSSSWAAAAELRPFKFSNGAIKYCINGEKTTCHPLNARARTYKNGFMIQTFHS